MLRLLGMPRGLRFSRITTELPTERPKTGIVDKVGVSMFHQLHCLDMIRKEVGRLHREGGQEESSGAESLFHREHYLHCFDYLAQLSGC